MNKLMMVITCLAMSGYVFGEGTTTSAPSDGGTEAIAEAQETKPPVEKFKSAEKVLAEVAKAKGWQTRWDRKKGRIIKIESAEFVCKDPATDKKFFTLRDMAAKKAVLKAKVGNLFWFFYDSFTGSAAVIGFSMLPAKLFAGRPKPAWYRGVLWIGCNTLGILVLHKPLLPEVVAPMLVRAGLDEASILLSVLSTLITLPYTVVLTLLLKKYFPALLGLHRRRESLPENAGDA